MNYNDIYDLYFKMPHDYNLNRTSIKIENLHAWLNHKMHVNKEFRFRSILLLTDIGKLY